MNLRVANSLSLRERFGMRAGPLALLALLLCPFCMGCATGVDSTYGVQTEPVGKLSVNGTGVLANLFRSQGHRVHSWRALSPRLYQADVIVWFPDSFQPPNREVREWLENWFYGGDVDRTLIYVGRDFDAAPIYWQTVKPGAPAEERAAIDERLQSAVARFTAARTTAGGAESTAEGWFTVQGEATPHRAQKLSGPWSAGVTAVRAEIYTNGWLTPRDDAAILLETEDGPFISRLNADDAGGQIILVENGSCFLNLPLVNHEHRQLAAELVDAVGPDAKDVVFLESDADGPPILAEDPEAATPSGWQLLAVWPINFVLIHLAALGVVFCAARIGVFGLPRELASDSLSDYGRHADAVGELLRKTGDRTYAEDVLAVYDQWAGGKREVPAASALASGPSSTPSPGA